MSFTILSESLNDRREAMLRQSIFLGQIAGLYSHCANPVKVRPIHDRSGSNECLDRAPTALHLQSSGDSQIDRFRFCATGTPWAFTKMSKPPNDSTHSAITSKAASGTERSA